MKGSLNHIFQHLSKSISCCLFDAKDPKDISCTGSVDILKEFIGNRMLIYDDLV